MDTSDPDPTDGRKILLSITASGAVLRESLIDFCDEWAAKTMQAIFTREESRIVVKATDLLERLARAIISLRINSGNIWGIDCFCPHLSHQILPDLKPF